ncbi:MAG: VOC family protein [Prolixibacteraceae bacterium]
MNLNQVTVPSIDLSIAIPFYEKLGLILIVSSTINYARFECPDGDSTFSIHKLEHLHPGPGIVVYFEEENLDEKVKQLQELGVKFSLLPTDQPWLWREAHLTDPDGNKIILFHAGENRKNPPWRLDH